MFPASLLTHQPGGASWALWSEWRPLTACTLVMHPTICLQQPAGWRLRQAQATPFTRMHPPVSWRTAGDGGWAGLPGASRQAAMAALVHLICWLRTVLGIFAPAAGQAAAAGAAGGADT